MFPLTRSKFDNLKNKDSQYTCMLYVQQKVKNYVCQLCQKVGGFAITTTKILREDLIHKKLEATQEDAFIDIDACLARVEMVMMKA